MSSLCRRLSTSRHTPRKGSGSRPINVGRSLRQLLHSRATGPPATAPSICIEGVGDLRGMEALRGQPHRSPAAIADTMPRTKHRPLSPRRVAPRAGRQFQTGGLASGAKMPALPHSQRQAVSARERPPVVSRQPNKRGAVKGASSSSLLPSLLLRACN